MKIADQSYFQLNLTCIFYPAHTTVEPRHNVFVACLVFFGLFGNCEMAWCEGRGVEVAACIAVMKNTQQQLSSLNGGQLMVSSFIGAGSLRG